MTEHENSLDEQGQARRRFLKQAGAAAWAAPFIVTMMSRTAHAQTGCGEVGLTPGVCEVTVPCGTGQTCIPDVAAFDGSCICVSTPGG